MVRKISGFLGWGLFDGWFLVFGFSGCVWILGRHEMANAVDMFCQFNDGHRCNDRCMLAIEDLNNNSRQCAIAVIGLMSLVGVGNIKATIYNVKAKKK